MISTYTPAFYRPFPLYSLDNVCFFTNIATKLTLYALNNKEFISELSRKLGYTNKDTSQLVSSVIGVMTQELQDGNNIAIQGFGTFEVKKKLERISINPATQQRMLIPPKLVLTYKPSVTLKERFK